MLFFYSPLPIAFSINAHHEWKSMYLVNIHKVWSDMLFVPDISIIYLGESNMHAFYNAVNN